MNMFFDRFQDIFSKQHVRHMQNENSYIFGNMKGMLKKESSQGSIALVGIFCCFLQ